MSKRRKKKGDPVHGWINLNKPLNMTSTQALGKVRYLLKAQKAGHAGTLDPLADGVLPIALGEATKTIPYAQGATKIYRFTVKWGEQTETDDTEGSITHTSPIRPSKDQVQSILPHFTGVIEQTPPAYSAIKIDGQRAYDLARKGKNVQLKSRNVCINELSIIEHEKEQTSFQVTCETGTYVRSLARDIAIALETYGHVITLQRIKNGVFHLDTAISLDFLEEIGHIAAREQALLPLDCVLDDIPALNLSEQEAARITTGQTVSMISKPDFLRFEQAGLDQITDTEEPIALLRYNRKPLALAYVHGTNIKPKKVFNL